MLFFKRNSVLASHVPLRKTKGSTGSDLYAAENKTIKSGSKDLAHLELYVIIPKGYYDRIVGRSGLAYRKIMLHCGTVDSDYRGTISVIDFNLSRNDYNIEVGDRVAQMIFEKYYCPKFVEVTESEWEKFVKDESGNQRKECGFGSTGK